MTTEWENGILNKIRPKETSKKLIKTSEDAFYENLSTANQDLTDFPVLRKLSQILSEEQLPKSWSDKGLMKSLQASLISRIGGNETVMLALRDQIILDNDCLLSLILQSNSVNDQLTKDTDAYVTVREMISKIENPISLDVINQLGAKVNGNNASVRDVILYLAHAGVSLDDDDFYRALEQYLNKESDLDSAEHKQVIDALLLLPQSLARAFKARVGASVLRNKDDLNRKMSSLCDKKPAEANRSLIWHIVSAGKKTAKPKSTDNLRDFKLGLQQGKSANPLPSSADESAKVEDQQHLQCLLNADAEVSMNDVVQYLALAGGSQNDTENFIEVCAKHLLSENPSEEQKAALNKALRSLSQSQHDALRERLISVSGDPRLKEILKARLPLKNCAFIEIIRTSSKHRDVKDTGSYSTWAASLLPPQPTQINVIKDEAKRKVYNVYAWFKAPNPASGNANLGGNNTKNTKKKSEIFGL